MLLDSYAYTGIDTGRLKRYPYDLVAGMTSAFAMQLLTQTCLSSHDILVTVVSCCCRFSKAFVSKWCTACCVLGQHVQLSLQAITIQTCLTKPERIFLVI
eukprot:5557892-Amphidinium_carterae.1